MSANIKKMFTEEEVRLALLEQSNLGINLTLNKINDELKDIRKEIKESFNKLDSKIDKLDSKIDNRNSKFDAKIDKLYWMILGLYGSGFAILLNYFLKSKGYL